MNHPMIQSRRRDGPRRMGMLAATTAARRPVAIVPQEHGNQA